MECICRMQNNDELLGTTIATKKEEIVAICDHMNICIDNPLSILTQDTSRMFLANSTPKDKYNVSEHIINDALN